MKSKILRKILVGLMLAVFLFIPVASLVYAQSGAGVVQCDGPEGAGNKTCDFNAFLETANKLIEMIIYLAASGAALLFAYAGFLYITAQGETGKISAAHAIFKNVAVGFIVILLAWLFVKLILDILLDPSKAGEVKSLLQE